MTTPKSPPAPKHEGRAGKIPACHEIGWAGRQNLKSTLQFDSQGLIPTVIQDQKTKKVLTLCYLTREALDKSLKEGKVYVFRRSHNRLMLKGETSGHLQRIRQVHVDCEGKSLLFVVRQHVAGCHQGYLSCYFRRLTRQGRLTIADKRVFHPAKVSKA